MQDPGAPERSSVQPQQPVWPPQPASQQPTRQGADSHHPQATARPQGPAGSPSPAGRQATDGQVTGEDGRPGPARQPTVAPQNPSGSERPAPSAQQDTGAQAGPRPDASAPSPAAGPARQPNGPVHQAAGSAQEAGGPTQQANGPGRPVSAAQPANAPVARPAQEEARSHGRPAEQPGGDASAQGAAPSAADPASAWPQYNGPSQGKGRIAAELGLAGRKQPDPTAQDAQPGGSAEQARPVGSAEQARPGGAPTQPRPGQAPPGWNPPAAPSSAASSVPPAQNQAVRRPLGSVQTNQDDETKVFDTGLVADQGFGPDAQRTMPVSPAALRDRQGREAAYAGTARASAGRGQPPPPGGRPPSYPSGDPSFGRGFDAELGEPDQPRRSRRPALLVGGGLGALLFVAYIALIFIASGRVPGGTTVAGVDIGGLDRAAAEKRLNEELTERAEKPLQVVVGDEERTIRPDRAGLELDIPATVDEAYVGRTLNPVALLGALGGGEPVTPVGKVDEGKLDAALGALAKDTDREAREGKIAFKNGEVQTVMPVAGQTLDVGAAGGVLQEAFLKLRPDRRVELPVTKVAPAITRKEIEQSVQAFAEPAMSGPVILEIGDDTVEASPEQLGKALSMVPDTDGLKPRLDGKALLKALKDDLEGVLTKPRDATIQLVGDQPRVVPGKSGQAIQPKKLAAAVMPALTKSGDERVAKVPTTKKEPDITTEEVEGYGIKEVVGEFTTYFPHSADNYRNINLGRAAELINGTLVEPGGIFSLNDTVGERTEANGFTTGLVIKGGQLRRELGGGVSQVTTTVYNAAFFAGMKDIEHHPHGFYISRYPEGREATVYWGSLDMRWQNTTPYGVYVQAWIEPSTPSSQGSVTVRLWSTKYYEVKSETSERYNLVPPKTKYDESDECVEQPEGVPGFEVDVKRWIYHDGKLVDQEVDHVKYQPEHIVICGPDPKKKG